MDRRRLRPGTLLIPKGILPSDVTSIWGLVVRGERDEWNVTYEVFTSDGSTKWTPERTLLLLWDAVDHGPG